MDSHGFMGNLIVYLSAAVITVPLFTRFGLGSVLGYLVAGIIIGPWGFGFIGNVDDILHFSEIGVVLLLFLIGLELEPMKLWGMRKPILGAGGLQLLLTGSAIGGIALMSGMDWRVATIIGLGLSLSSTAIALQLLNEKRLLSTPMGKTGFSILLFQDISVIPIIAIIPMLALEPASILPKGGNISTLIIIGIIAGIFIIGRYALRHIFRFVAATHLPELFTALSLLLVCGLAAIMNYIGISMALGAFLGGVILADSEYRHALESDIQPFKGLLLGLFFISVGMSVDFGLLLSQPVFILSMTIVLVLIKSIVLYLIAMITGIPDRQRGLFSFLFSQSGEFGFVLFGFAVTANVIGQDLADQLILIIAMSMVITPLLMLFNDRVIEPRYTVAPDRPMDEIIDEENQVILVGFGRFGQVIGRMLHANKITPTVIDHDPDHIERVRRFGYKTYYGDVLRHDILHSIGAEKAKLIILTGEGMESNNKAIDMIQKEFPNLTIIARARDRTHAMYLIDKKVEGVTREAFYSAIEMGKTALETLGFSQRKIEKLVKLYVKHDVETLHKQVGSLQDEAALISIAQSAREQLEQTLEADQQEETGMEQES
jgi:glutathione-regulated potassium-efflux system ancillary protein KefC